MSDNFQRTRSSIKSHPERGSYHKKTIYKIIDDALICHVGFVLDDQPFVIPTIHARSDDQIILHGSKGSRLLKVVKSGVPVSICFTHLDGLVLARSAMHSSMNYRSVVLFGTGREITDDLKKLEAMEIIFEHLIPGRWQDVREPNQKELDVTAIVAVDIEEASAKIRTEPPIDDEEDCSLPIWSGVVPFRMAAGKPEADPHLEEGITLPDYIRNYLTTTARS